MPLSDFAFAVGAGAFGNRRIVHCAESHQPSSGNVLPLGVDESQQMAEFFGVLADPTRLRLISLLSASECCVCDLAESLSVTESAVSHQLRALRNDGRRMGPRPSLRKPAVNLDEYQYQLHSFPVLV